ncbi:MAG: UvrD-helicase domain-containing protein [Gammaproteobacteria bacterium]|nr:UvrD-helicase domain-containing protein [Gammaproteobacteria bacterium]
MIDLSSQQRAALHYINGPLLVLAGAGCGKTSLLARKMAWLIREYDVNPAQITAVAVNPSAARRLRAHVADYGKGHTLPSSLVSTFAELSLNIIRERLAALELRPGFSLYDHQDSIAVISRLLREALPETTVSANAVHRQIARWKRDRVEPSATIALADHSTDNVAGWIYRRYQARLAAANAVDLDDLTLKAVRLLAAEPALLDQWVERVRFLVVDDYEQTTVCEHELVRLLVNRGAILTAASDRYQSIDENNCRHDTLQRLQTDLLGLRTVTLEQNFRSSTRILQVANAFIAPINHDDQRFWGEGELGEPLRAIRTRNEEHEAECVVSDLINHKSQRNLDYRHYAILFRKSAQAAFIERALRARRIPYYVRGGASFYDQTEIRDLLAYLKLLSNPLDDHLFLRAANSPRRMFDRTTIEQLVRCAASSRQTLFEAALDPALATMLDQQRLSALHSFVDVLTRLRQRAEYDDPAELVRQLLIELRYEEWLRDTCNDLKIAERRMENVMQIVAALQRRTRQQPEARLPELAAQLHLNAALDPEGEDAAGDCVALLTYAAVKGREFSHVYMVGFEEEVSTAPASHEALNAERRCAYAVVTRASAGLTFTTTERRRIGGEIVARRPSQLLNELPAGTIAWANDEFDPPNTENSLSKSDSFLINTAYRPKG